MTYTVPSKAEMIHQQHAHIFELLNRIYGVLKQDPCPTQELMYVSKKIQKNFLRHFETEESFFDPLKYPNAAEHKKQHELFIKAMSSLVSKIEKPGASIKPLAKEIADFGLRWITKHEIEIDQRMPLLAADGATKKKTNKQSTRSHG